MQFLLDHGAALDTARVEACLRNGRGKAARFLASLGAQLDLETAAGVGNLETVRSCLNDDGEKFQRGFLWACEYGHNDVVEFLLAHGANLRDQAKTGQTALHWAVIGGQLSTDQTAPRTRSAPLEELNAYDVTALGQAGWSFLNGEPRIDYVPVFEALLSAGAAIEDGWLAWLDKQDSRPAVSKARIAEVLRRYAAIT